MSAIGLRARLRIIFSRGNLTALRELALRRTAQRVDAQMVDYMQSHAIDGPWPAGERVLVAIDGGGGSAALVRRARRLAEYLRAPWTALHVETSRELRCDEAERKMVAETLQLANAARWNRRHSSWRGCRNDDPRLRPYAQCHAYPCRSDRPGKLARHFCVARPSIN